MTEFARLAEDPVALTQRLVGFNTINPPGENQACADFVQALLRQAGFTVSAHAHKPGSVSLVARAGPVRAARAVCFVGHLDTVPLGRAKWAQDPFAGEIVGDRLYGRGATDMKSAVAAFIVAAAARARSLPPDTEIVLLLVAAEETGCEGSRHLAGLGLPLQHFGGIIVGEPTLNFPQLGHKGAFWLRAIAKGVSAHGAMPHAGVNAIKKAADIVGRLAGFCDDRTPHPVLGRATINIGTFHSGENVNSVPDWAEIGIDLRTVPGMDHAHLEQELRELLAPDLHDLKIDLSLDHVYSPPEHPWVQQVFAIVERENGSPPDVKTASYFTDASALKPVVGDTPLIILGPGEPTVMHQTDEYCDVPKIHEAVRIYGAVIDMTLALQPANADAAAAIDS